MSLTYLLSGDPWFECLRLMQGATIASPCASSTLDASVDVAASALAKAIQQKRRLHGGKYHDIYIVVPLSFPAFGDHWVDVRMTLKNHRKCLAQQFCAIL